MATGLSELVEEYSSRGILVDTNILLLWTVGSVDESLIRSFKRTRQFVPEDYRLLDSLLSRFSRHVCTPNVLTEVSNHIGFLSGKYRLRSFRRLAQSVAALDERYIPSAELSGDNDFEKIGLPDCSIKAVAAASLLVLTDDLDLYGILNAAGIDCINFNHLRPAGWS